MPKKRRTTVNRKKQVIYNLLLLIALSGFVFSAYKLYSIYTDYKMIDDNNSAIRNIAFDNSKLVIEEDVDPNDINFLPVVNFQALKEMNSEIIGYIYIPNTEINYPITQAVDNHKYLETTANLLYSAGGSIFVDFRNDSFFNDRNTLIYGHAMRNNSMFGSLSNYKKQSFLDQHPYVFIYTENAIHKYQIFSFHQDTHDSYVYNIYFESDDSFLTFTNSLASKSVINSSADLNSGNRIITLSTCTNITDEGRYLLHAILVESKDI
jgi:sortase, SrtB family